MSNPDIFSRAPQIEAIVGYTFSNKTHAVEAVQMAAPQIATVVSGSISRVDNNRRLAVLGNAVLAKVLCAAWFGAHTPLQLTDWDRLRNELLSNDTLAARGFNLGLDTCVITNAGNSGVSSKMMSTTVEAVIGAIYEDGGDDAVHLVLTNMGFFQHALLTVM
ncbi:ribonuclease III [Plenodomus tracheiphilus IPT5]|uniref:Ribonuclease III n=1 Tax=Plenodomus tracheiphilus IPT5 TaxID=1408161 RepID=A0A6A7AR33_9PLEO|nr:ribonuclease III [Plenodomus tracheiphilus IPT5]